MQERHPKDEADKQERAEEASERAGTEPPAQEEAAAKDAEIAELKKQLLYLRADFENTKKRIEKRHRENAEFATEGLLKDLLPVLDNLEKALLHSKEPGPEASSGILEGLEMIVDQFRSVLGRHGIEDVTAHGEKFDPNVHDAMVQVPGEQDNQVAEVYEKGYRLKGRLLRPAKVAVTKVATREGDG